MLCKITKRKTWFHQLGFQNKKNLFVRCVIWNKKTWLCKTWFDWYVLLFFVKDALPEGWNSMVICHYYSHNMYVYIYIYTHIYIYICIDRLIVYGTACRLL